MWSFYHLRLPADELIGKSLENQVDFGESGTKDLQKFWDFWWKKPPRCLFENQVNSGDPVTSHFLISLENHYQLVCLVCVSVQFSEEQPSHVQQGWDARSEPASVPWNLMGTSPGAWLVEIVICSNFSKSDPAAGFHPLGWDPVSFCAP